MKQVQEQTDFEEDLVRKVIVDTFENFCDTGRLINVDQMNDHARSIVDEIYKELHKQKKMFKYSVTVFLQQKNGAAMNFGSAMFAEEASDGQVTCLLHDHPSYDLMISVAGFKITQK